MNRVFLISPANCNGERARWIFTRTARSDMARRLRRPEGAPLGEVYTFLSALYFRGKLSYARAFARPASGAGIFIITPTAGLLPHDAPVRLSRLRGFRRVPISLKNRRYRSSLTRGAKQLAAEVGPDCEIVLLGSIASGKYLGILQRVLGDQLRVPAELVGLGDMARGALLLRCVKQGRELTYVSVGEIARIAAMLPAQRSRRAADAMPAGETAPGAAEITLPRTN